MSASRTLPSPATLSPALPTAVTTFLERSASEKPAGARQTFTETAVVVDYGTTYTGDAAIADWLVATAAEIAYTTTRLRTEKNEAETIVVDRVEGNFPGRRVEVTYRFELDGESGLIHALTISA